MIFLADFFDCFLPGLFPNSGSHLYYLKQKFLKIHLSSTQFRLLIIANFIVKNERKGVKPQYFFNKKGTQKNKVLKNFAPQNSPYVFLKFQLKKEGHMRLIIIFLLLFVFENYFPRKFGGKMEVRAMKKIDKFFKLTFEVLQHSKST
ncbi:MAG: hypothetical protein CM15mP22_7650 [Gammaproteobacteria bacterium]|nr:MAG: hypothetical protein CM15mP22_7650 [Gammaproteobacteria bacterium]